MIIIGGTITAFTLGIGNTFRLLTGFAGTVGRFAFGGLFRNSLRGLTKVFGTALAKLTPLLPILGVLSGPSGVIARILGFLGIGGLTAGLDDTAKSITGEKIVNAGGASAATEGKFLPTPRTKVQITGDVTKQVYLED